MSGNKGCRSARHRYLTGIRAAYIGLTAVRGCIFAVCLVKDIFNHFKSLPVYTGSVYTFPGNTQAAFVVICARDGMTSARTAARAP